MKLTGDRNQCRGQGCGEYFRSAAAFDAHRTGPHGPERRCMSTTEMTTKGMLKNADGFWITAAMPDSAHKQAREGSLQPGAPQRRPENTIFLLPIFPDGQISVHAASQLGEVESMKRCQKFDSCSASLCPLDPKWRQRYFSPADRICTWMLEMAKAGPTAQAVPDTIREEIAAIAPHLVASDGTGSIARRMHTASMTPSRRSPEATAQRMQAMRAGPRT